VISFIGTGKLLARGSRVRFPAGAGNFSLHQHIQTGSGAHPASYPVGTRGSFAGVKRPVREADHSPPSSDLVPRSKNDWSYTSTPNTPSWRGVHLKKAQVQLYLLLKSDDTVRNKEYVVQQLHHLFCCRADKLHAGGWSTIVSPRWATIHSEVHLRLHSGSAAHKGLIMQTPIFVPLKILVELF
jgi:hypothetical protein